MSKKSNQQKKRRKKTGKAIGFAVGAVVLVVLLVFVALFVMDHGRIAENLTIAGVEVGGMTKDEAMHAIEPMTEAYRQNSLSVTLPDGELSLNPADTGAALDTEKAVKAAYRYGRLFGLVRLPGAAAGPTEPTAVDLSDCLNLDQTYIHRVLDEKAETVKSKLTQTKVEVKDSTEQVEETATDEDGNETTQQVEKDVKIMTLTMGTAERALDAKALYQTVMEAYSAAAFTGTEVEYTETLPDKLDVQKLYDEYCTPAEDARYDAEIHDVVPEVLGFGFILEDVQKQVDEAKEGEVLTITLRELLPEVTRENLDSVLFQDTLASYDSPHTAIPNRTNNLELACAAIDGTVLNSGDVFSFNKVVGERTADKGYRSAAIYSGGKTLDELGGGVCQVASTIYMCTLHADLEIVERECHQFTVDYVPMGMDATVYWGELDYQFRNNTDYPIRIDASVSDGYVHIRLMGTETKDYTIDMTYEVLGTTSPSTEYREITDGSYSDGEVIQSAHTGYRVVSYKHKLDKDGNEISCEEEARSNYHVSNKVIASVKTQETSTPETTKPETTPPETAPETTPPPETSPEGDIA